MVSRKKRSSVTPTPKSRNKLNRTSTRRSTISTTSKKSKTSSVKSTFSTGSQISNPGNLPTKSELAEYLTRKSSNASIYKRKRCKNHGKSKITKLTRNYTWDELMSSFINKMVTLIRKCDRNKVNFPHYYARGFDEDIKPSCSVQTVKDFLTSAYTHGPHPLTSTIYSILKYGIENGILRACDARTFTFMDKQHNDLDDHISEPDVDVNKMDIDESANFLDEMNKAAVYTPIKNDKTSRHFLERYKAGRDISSRTCKNSESIKKEDPQRSSKDIQTENTPPITKEMTPPMKEKKDESKSKTKSKEKEKKKPVGKGKKDKKKHDSSSDTSSSSDDDTSNSELYDDDRKDKKQNRKRKRSKSSSSSSEEDKEEEKKRSKKRPPSSDHSEPSEPSDTSVDVRTKKTKKVLTKTKGRTGRRATNRARSPKRVQKRRGKSVTRKRKPRGGIVKRRKTRTVIRRKKKVDWGLRSNHAEDGVKNTPKRTINKDV